MAKTNKIECELYRSKSCSWTSLTRSDGNSPDLWDTWEVLQEVAPALCKGLRHGQSRKLILTQIKRGIKLEVKP